jgi:hypothetical protein
VNAANTLPGSAAPALTTDNQADEQSDGDCEEAAVLLYTLAPGKMIGWTRLRPAR